MARIVVIGGGFGGLASALRLAKLGHEVTLLEGSSRLGGAMQAVSKDGFTWDGGPTSTLLPAVLRDLFRKTGRPIDHEVELVPVSPATEHRFPDGTYVSASREDPEWIRSRPSTNSEPGLGRPGATMSRRTLKRGICCDVASSSVPMRKQWRRLSLRQLLSSRESLDARIHASLHDPRLRAVAAFLARFEGHDPRRVPAWVGVDAYLVQRFGVWTVRGGFDLLAQSLVNRLATRGVTTMTDHHCSRLGRATRNRRGSRHRSRRTRLRGRRLCHRSHPAPRLADARRPSSCDDAAESLPSSPVRATHCLSPRGGLPRRSARGDAHG